MLICLDTNALINVVERSTPTTLDAFCAFLVEGHHELALPFGAILEMSAPLTRPDASSVVSSTLNRLEVCPHKFVADGTIEVEEMKVAWAAFTSGNEYASIDPIVNRLDKAAGISSLVPTRMYLDYSMAAVMFDLAAESPLIFGGHREHLSGFTAAVESMRQSIASMPTHYNYSARLRKAIEGKLLFYRSRGLLIIDQGVADDDFADFSRWVSAMPGRCPSVKMSFGVMHALAADTTYKPHASDIEDITHILCLPYVDLITTDSHMAKYAKAAARRLRLTPAERIFSSLDLLLTSLGFSGI